MNSDIIQREGHEQKESVNLMHIQETGANLKNNTLSINIKLKFLNVTVLVYECESWVIFKYEKYYEHSWNVVFKNNDWHQAHRSYLKSRDQA